MAALDAIPGDSRPSAPKPAAKPIPPKKVAAPAAAAPILVSESVRGFRLDACLACEKLVENGYCSEGQWFVRIKAKLASGNCPLKRWPTVTPSPPATSADH